MLRRVRILIVFLLLGAIVNVAVAWGCLRFSPPTGFWNGWTESGSQGVGWRYQCGANIELEYRAYEISMAGWPTLALRSDVPGASIREKTKPLPFCPIGPGFVINTIFYAAVLWMVFAFPFALRRRRRIKRGLCPACAYPIGTSPVCTECGKPVKATIKL